MICILSITYIFKLSKSNTQIEQHKCVWLCACLVMQGASQEFVAGPTDKTALPIPPAPITQHIIPESVQSSSQLSVWYVTCCRAFYKVSSSTKGWKQLSSLEVKAGWMSWGLTQNGLFGLLQLLMTRCMQWSTFFCIYLCQDRENPVIDAWTDSMSFTSGHHFA